MPIYEYACQACDHVFERLAKNSQDNPTECPACKKDDLKKLFSTFAPAMGSSQPAAACPAAADCPSGACCGGGGCPV